MVRPHLSCGNWLGLLCIFYRAKLNKTDCYGSQRWRLLAVNHIEVALPQMQ
jgi:hypothetical protein